MPFSLPWLFLFGSKMTPSPWQVVQNLENESYFVAVGNKGRGFRGERSLAGPRKGKIVFILSPKWD